MVHSDTLTVVLLLRQIPRRLVVDGLDLVSIDVCSDSDVDEVKSEINENVGGKLKEYVWIENHQVCLFFSVVKHQDLEAYRQINIGFKFELECVVVD